MLAIHYCETCNEDFAVREGKDPNGCPFCYSPEIAWSHSIDVYGEK
ncbi:hypothetical protein [Bacillus sp. JJ722]